MLHKRAHAVLVLLFLLPAANTTVICTFLHEINFVGENSITIKKKLLCLQLAATVKHSTVVDKILYRSAASSPVAPLHLIESNKLQRCFTKLYCIGEG